jgi:hypothetical protein
MLIHTVKSPHAYHVYRVSSNQEYTSDGEGFISPVADSDLQDLVNAGCEVVQIEATGEVEPASGESEPEAEHAEGEGEHHEGSEEHA